MAAVFQTCIMLEVPYAGIPLPCLFVCCLTLPSRFEPPGWISGVARSCESTTRNGKNASDAITVPFISAEVRASTDFTRVYVIHRYLRSPDSLQSVVKKRFDLTCFGFPQNKRFFSSQSARVYDCIQTPAFSKKRVVVLIQSPPNTMRISLALRVH